jgi:hypothetical protein
MPDFWYGTAPFEGWEHRFDSKESKEHYEAHEKKWCKLTKERFEANPCPETNVRLKAGRLQALADWIQMFEGKV